MPIIKMENLTKNYGKSRGIQDVNLQIEEGEIFGFIGQNGAGKSTTIRTLLNFIFPSAGSATILGKDCVKESSQIKKFVGYVPSEVNYYGNMSVDEIIKYAASFYNFYDTDRINKLCNIFEVQRDKKMRELSLGNKKKVAIIQALVVAPKLIILDEPTNGLDPLMQRRLFEVLKEENKKGMTIFFSSHNLIEVQEFCHRVAIIRDGKIVALKAIDNISHNSNRKVRIKANSDIKIDLKNLNIESIEKEGDYFNFLFKGDINLLIKSLSLNKIEDLQITEPSLLDTFMEFYEKEHN